MAILLRAEARVGYLLYPRGSTGEPIPMMI
nr:MAG TPA: Enterobactin synthase component F [Caudoviricetes sp.]